MWQLARGGSRAGKSPMPQILTLPSTSALTPNSSRSQSQHSDPPLDSEIISWTQQAPLDVLQPNVSTRSRRNVPRLDYHQLHNIGNKQANYAVSDDYYLDTATPDLHLAFSAAVATARSY